VNFILSKFTIPSFGAAIAFLNDPLLIRRWRKSSVNFILSKFTDLSFEAAIAPYREDKKRSRFIFINWQQVALSRPTINIYLFQFRVLLKVRL